MKYIEEFRNGELAAKIAEAIARAAKPDTIYRLMEFCGGHTHAISRYGLRDLLPKNVHMIHGPGCPVCVLPIGRIDSAISLALENKVTLFTYADTMRVPASRRQSFLKVKAQGADIRMVYTCSDALTFARENPDQEVVFFAIGFETTTPPTAVIIKEAAALKLKNFSVFCNHVLTPPAIAHILNAPKSEAITIDGFIGPAHVSTIIGSAAYEPFTREYHKPVVIAGFEPLDVLQAVLMLVTQFNENRAVVENEFTRAVSREGNTKAIALMNEVFTIRDTFEWRGLGRVAKSALKIREAYAPFDAESRYAISYVSVPDHKACECGAILRGQKEPYECRAFGVACTPDNPLGACMVSSEGACAAHYTYGRFRNAPKT